MDEQKNIQKSLLQSPRGTRDFYPELMVRQQWLFDLWRTVSLRHGFEEYDGPIFEHLDLYQIKSGDEIVSQLFSFADRGGRNLALRPELTPTLARMVAAKASSLPRPIKWFSIPRLCRAERPQRGRLREFFQWNIDIMGSGDVLADAECIFVALDFLRQIGLGPELVELRVNSRPIVAALLTDAGIGADRHEQFYAILDKFDKLPSEQFDAFAREQKVSQQELMSLKNMLNVPNLAALSDLATSEDSQRELAKLQELHRDLASFGVGDYFVYKPSVVRGLAYYTGIVFEIFDRSAKMRAIAGGGRYDNLISMFGGPAMPACGFGMGDVVLMDLLEDLGKIPSLTPHHPPEFFVIDAEAELFSLALKITGQLRKQNFVADYSPKRQAVGKQLKYADSRRALIVLILGSETRDQNLVTVKNLKTGKQLQIDLERFLENPDQVRNDTADES
ncbi:MAG: histidine--tRNA ligase [Phycisphaerae bacterium]